jgi:hypothetical protein
MAVCAAAAPVLVMVAVLLATGCVAEKQELPAGNYIFVEHFVHRQWNTVEGDCSPMPLFDGPLYFMDEKTGVLSVYVCQWDQVNESLNGFYASGHGGSGGGGGGEVSSASPVYTFPRTFPDGVTLDSVARDGVVSLHYQNTTITLKPGERLVVNTTRSRVNESGIKGAGCTKEIVITDWVSNAGIFEKEKIQAHNLTCHRGP